MTEKKEAELAEVFFAIIKKFESEMTVSEILGVMETVKFITLGVRRADKKG